MSTHPRELSALLLAATEMADRLVEFDPAEWEGQKDVISAGYGQIGDHEALHVTTALASFDDGARQQALAWFEWGLSELQKRWGEPARTSKRDFKGFRPRFSFRGPAEGFVELVWRLEVAAFAGWRRSETVWSVIWLLSPDGGDAGFFLEVGVIASSHRS